MTKILHPECKENINSNVVNVKKKAWWLPVYLGEFLASFHFQS